MSYLFTVLFTVWVTATIVSLIHKPIINNYRSAVQTHKETVLIQQAYIAYISNELEK